MDSYFTITTCRKPQQFVYSISACLSPPSLSFFLFVMTSLIDTLLTKYPRVMLIYGYLQQYSLRGMELFSQKSLF